jgi:glutathione S-transferase
MTSTMYDLYIANKNYSSWSLRPWVLMRMLGIAFNEKLVPFGTAPDGSNEFRSFSPSGKVPCLVDAGHTMWDSLGITEYLAERHAGVWPEDPVARAWARCAAAEMHSGFFALRERCSMICSARIQLFDTPPALMKDLLRLSELWADGLERFGGPFLAGDKFTAVDAFFAPVAFRIQTYGLELATPVQEYAERLLALEPMRQWESEALKEPWRDEPHEAESRAAGRWIEDLRPPA